jgi:CRP-like cAMP-binding protein
MSKLDVSLLAGVPLFAELSTKELREVASLAKPAHHAEGEVMVAEDAPGSRFYVLQTGTARVVRNGRTRATLGPGDYFGELAVLDGGPKIATKLLTSLAIRLREAERSDTT